MKLHSLIKSKGLRKKQQRVGRGNSSKYGNYSRKGHKGQKARSGFSLHPAFEGGQTSTFMRLPKRRGFKRYFKLLNDIAVINVSRLEKSDKIKTKDTINKAKLQELGFIRKADIIVKILGTGEISKALTFQDIDLFSSSAIKKIEKAGGKIENQSASTDEKPQETKEA